MAMTSLRSRTEGLIAERTSGSGSTKHTTAAAPTTILVVGRDRLFADAIGVVLDQRGAYRILSVASSEPALRLAVELRPAIALISLELADVAAADGVSLVARMRAEAPMTVVLGMVDAHDKKVAARAAKLGLQGVITANDSVARFMQRIAEAIQRGGTEIRSPRERRSGLPNGQLGSEGVVFGVLTTREFEVLELLEQSLNGSEIADSLGISRNTVGSHLQSIFHKLRVHSRLEAAAFAVEHDMFELPPAERQARGDRSSRPERSA